MTEKAKPAPSGRYRVLCGGVEWAKGKVRYEHGEIAENVPPLALKAWLASGKLEEVKE